jgi:hypothetical protein
MLRREIGGAVGRVAAMTLAAPAVAAREHEGTGVAAEEIGELIPAGSSGASLG